MNFVSKKIPELFIIFCIFNLYLVTVHANCDDPDSLSATGVNKDAWTKLTSAEATKILSPAYQNYSLSNIKKLEWICEIRHEFKLNDFIHILNLMPNLHELKLVWWTEPFIQDASTTITLSLPHLKSLIVTDGSRYDPFMIEAFAQILPKNTLQSLHAYFDIAAGTLWKFLSNQQSIQHLDIEGDVTDILIFEHLKLVSLRYDFRAIDSDATNQMNAHKNFTQTQTDLVSLDCLQSSYITDEIFSELCNLKQLESLKVNIDYVSPSKIQQISKLSKLKTLWIRAYYHQSLESFNLLSLINNSPIKHLHFVLWSNEIPAETYQQFGENFSLKSLEITLGTQHSINFYMKTFPTLESMSIHFGASRSPEKLSDVFSDDGQKHHNMKHLKFHFSERDMMNNGIFFDMLRSLPNLESLEVQAKFTFTLDFLRQLSHNLGQIKALRISTFAVEYQEDFPTDIVESLKELRGKLQKVHLKLSAVYGYDEKKFSFKPLVDATMDCFKAHEDEFEDSEINTVLELDAGFS